MDRRRGRKGRPKFEISKDQIQFFLSNGFNARTISRMLQVSHRTIKRRMSEFNLGKSKTYSKISDNELDSAVKTICEDYPNIGRRKMKGFLLSKGLMVQEERIRESLRRTDPEGTILRTLCSRIVSRRKYSVAGPLSLYHIDGNHKLIRYLR